MPTSDKKSSKPPVAGPKMRECPHCGRENQVGAPQCWLCLNWLEPGMEGTRPVIVSQGPSTLRILGIVFGTLGIIFASGIAVIVALFAICTAALTQ